MREQQEQHAHSGIKRNWIDRDQHQFDWIGRQPGRFTDGLTDGITHGVANEQPERHGIADR